MKRYEEIKIYTTPDEKILLKQLAEEHNMSLSTYLKEAGLADKEIVIEEKVEENIILKIETNDLFSILAEIKEIRDKISGISNTIIRTDKAYKREVEELTKGLEKMEDLLNERTLKIIENRKDIKEAAKKLLDKRK